MQYLGITKEDRSDEEMNWNVEKWCQNIQEPTGRNWEHSSKQKEKEKSIGIIFDLQTKKSMIFMLDTFVYTKIFLKWVVNGADRGQMPD